MSDCCASSSSTSPPGKKRCPVNGLEYATVPGKTVLHHVKEPWTLQNTAQPYYFCDDPACAVVYFGADGSLIEQHQLRTSVGCKLHNADALLCYCFGISRGTAAVTPALRDYVIQQTAAGLCACETRNPSGRCCLKDFPRSDVHEGDDGA